MATMGNSVDNGVHKNNLGKESIEIALITEVPRPRSYNVPFR